MGYIVRAYEKKDLPELIEIWNGVIEEGDAFPQLDFLDRESGSDHFLSQTYTGVAVNEITEEIVGLYILHPNNIGRCGHIANAGYMVKKGLRGEHIGDILVKDSINMAAECGFKILQFNAVVKSNIHAINLYIRNGFDQVGTIPKGFLLKDGRYEDIIIFYRNV